MINPNAAEIIAAGATVLVAGSAVFGDRGIAENVAAFIKEMNETRILTD